MYEQRNTVLGGQPTPERSMTRIENQVEMVKAMTSRIRGITTRNVEHAHQLGFFEPPKDAVNGVSPVITSMDDALRELERAVDSLDGSMNLFT